MIDEVDTSCPYCGSEKTRNERVYPWTTFAWCIICGSKGPDVSYNDFPPPLDIAIEKAYKLWHEQFQNEEMEMIRNEMGENWI